jgi:hypothetical protein
MEIDGTVGSRRNIIMDYPETISAMDGSFSVALPCKTPIDIERTQPQIFSFASHRNEKCSILENRSHRTCIGAFCRWSTPFYTRVAEHTIY